MENSTPPAPANDSHAQSDDDKLIVRALLGSLAVFVVLAGVVGAIYLVVNWELPSEPTVAQPVILPEKRTASILAAPRVPWTDVTQSAGIEFVHTTGAAGEKLLPETMGGGCAFLDVDQDGDQDVLFINACAWPDAREPTAKPATLALYINDGHGNFRDATEQYGLDISLYGMGVACGDYDADGRVDLFISCLGSDHLLRNVGGRFVDVTAEAGIAGDNQVWSVSCGWFDYDGDQDLDLLVTHYVEWSRDFDVKQNFRLTGGEQRGYGRPQAFAGTYPSLFRNDGQGKFTDVSEMAGLHIQSPGSGVPMAKSLGLAFEYLNEDDFLDCVIANDTVQNFLLVNQQNGTFAEMAALAGVAYDAGGAARGAMGIDIAAFRNDKGLGILIGNFANEMSALYVSRDRDLQFYDAAIANGLGPATRLQLTFGVQFLDFDLDGRLDIFQANGHLEEDISLVQASQRYEQSPQLLWHAGEDARNEFILCGETETGADFLKPMVGRGSAYADIDGDGDLDLIIAGCGQKPRLLRNDQQLGHHWLRVKLLGRSPNPDAIGARVVVRSPGLVQERLVSPTRGYLSQVELPLTFGLGTINQVDSVTVRWPDGTVQIQERPAMDQLIVISQVSLVE
jgi:enediyne biosynthesis protein E4